MKEEEIKEFKRKIKNEYKKRSILGKIYRFNNISIKNEKMKKIEEKCEIKDDINDEYDEIYKNKIVDDIVNKLIDEEIKHYVKDHLDLIKKENKLNKDFEKFVDKNRYLNNYVYIVNDYEINLVYDKNIYYSKDIPKNMKIAIYKNKNLCHINFNVDYDKNNKELITTIYYQCIYSENLIYKF